MGQSATFSRANAGVPNASCVNITAMQTTQQGLSVREAANMLSVSVGAVYGMVARNDLRPTGRRRGRGGGMTFDRDAVLRLAEKRRQDAATVAAILNQNLNCARGGGESE